MFNVLCPYPLGPLTPNVRPVGPEASGGDTMLGWMELLIVGVVSLCLAGIVVGAVVLVVSPRRGQEGRLATLEAEIRRLRADLDNLKK